jgi:hypothetical protein
MHDVWEMKSNVEYISGVMTNFLSDEIKCSSCERLGLTNVVLYDIPRFLILKTISNDSDCINLIDDIEQLFIRPSPSHPSFEYNVQTVLIVLEEDNIVYLRKTGMGYSSFNETSGDFELLNDVTSEHAGLASRWTIFIYESNDTVFEAPTLDKIHLDQNDLAATIEPEECTIDTVQGLLPSFKGPFKVSDIQIKLEHINTLLNKDGDINDIIIDGHLFITASNASPDHKVLAIPCYLASQIIDKQLKQMSL